VSFTEILSFLAIPSLLLGIAAFFYAIYQGKKAKNSEKEISELKQAMISYKYLKDLAFTHYDNGKYDESLDVFKKYLANNKDDKEWNIIINRIFRNETGKLFSDVFIFVEGEFPSISLLVQAYIVLEDKFLKSSPYPNIIKTLLNDFKKVFERKKSYHEFLIALFDKDWKVAKILLSDFIFFKDDDINTLFKNYVIKFLNKKLGINDEQFVDDIPF
jgi:tetratricopeptide (TPR) repeat protein